MVGDLNIIASITTMFFLISYGIVNFACFCLKISGTPNWRPSFKYSNMYSCRVAWCTRALLPPPHVRVCV